MRVFASWFGPILGVLLGVWATLGCERGRERAALAALAKPAPTAETAPPLGNRIAYELYRVRQRFGPPPGTLERTRQRCPDQTIHQASPDEASRTLILRQVDERVESRELVPLRITEQLRTHELDELGRGFQTGRERDRERLLRELERVAEHRYLGVYHVTEYAGPELVLRVGELRRKWAPGILRAWLVLYDLTTKQRLCAADITVRSDTEGAPISSRLRSETRQRLEVELGKSLVQKARGRLGELTSELRWPAGGDTEPE